MSRHKLFQIITYDHYIRPQTQIKWLSGRKSQKYKQYTHNLVVEFIKSCTVTGMSMISVWHRETIYWQKSEGSLVCRSAVRKWTDWSAHPRILHCIYSKRTDIEIGGIFMSNNYHHSHMNLQRQSHSETQIHKHPALLPLPPNMQFQDNKKHKASPSWSSWSTYKDTWRQAGKQQQRCKSCVTYFGFFLTMI